MSISPNIPTPPGIRRLRIHGRRGGSSVLFGVVIAAMAVCWVRGVGGIDGDAH